MDSSYSSKRRVESQQEEEHSTKRLNVTMGMETLDCSICFNPLEHPIFQVSALCVCTYRLVFQLKLLSHF